jgi:lipoprotein-anchoring transpeptidase ErfK/SrfK
MLQARRTEGSASMRRLLAAGVLAALILTVASVGDGAVAAVVVHVDRSSQTMDVIVDGAPRYRWRVSTGRPGFGTPAGIYHPQMLAARWFSRVYYNAPMPHAIFFHGGYAIHGTYDIARLGGPASHGCVRLDPGNAAILFGLVEREGTGGTTIVVR